VRSLLRTKIPSLVSSLAIAVSLFIVSIAYCFYISFQHLTLDFKDGYNIEVFFNEELSEADAINAFNSILLMDFIEQGNFINKIQAAQIFKQEFDEDIFLLIGENPLPFSAIYTVTDIYKNSESLKEVTDELNLLSSIDIAIYEKDAIIKFDNLLSNAMTSIFIVSFFILLIAIFFVSNTIQLVIYSKKNDILTYQLLGATKSFIKIPYLIEGMLHGLFGAFISIILLLLVYNFIDYYLSAVLMLRNLNFNEIILLNVILGMFLGFLGSSKALSSYVKD
tara:strand:- start:336 stop:1172 length:837 start_codon:yes stop_codon:yes gene_type:complete